MIYGMLCQMLPNRDGVVKLRMGTQTYETEEEAQEAVDQVRRQNLPFRGFVVSFPDPR